MVFFPIRTIFINDYVTRIIKSPSTNKFTFVYWSIVIDIAGEFIKKTRKFWFYIHRLLRISNCRTVVSYIMVFFPIRVIVLQLTHTVHIRLRCTDICRQIFINIPWIIYIWHNMIYISDPSGSIWHKHFSIWICKCNVLLEWGN